MSESESTQLPEPIPSLAIFVFVACVVGGGALLDFTLVAAILRTARNGLSCIILQLAIADIFLGVTVSLELWSSNARTWLFSDSGCVVFKGVHVFATTANSYLVVTAALHTLATINLEQRTVFRRSKRTDQDDDDEIRSSRHSLVASDSSTPPRTMNVDYRVTETSISVIQPIIFVWILSISLSIPEFILATPLHLDYGVTLCTVVDSGKRLYMYSLFALFNLLLPSIIMIVAGFLVFVKSKSKKILSQIDNNNLMGSLKLSLWLIIFYVTLCAPKSFFQAYDIYSTSLKRDDISFIEMAHRNDYFILMRVILSCTYLVSMLVRPLFCLFLLPRVRKIFSTNSRINETNDV